MNRSFINEEEQKTLLFKPILFLSESTIKHTPIFGGAKLMRKEMINNFVRITEVKKATGLSRSTIYLRISQGSYPRPIKLGTRAVGWPSKEVAAINAARMAGKTEDEIRIIVLHLESTRSNYGEKIVQEMMT